MQYGSVLQILPFFYILCLYQILEFLYFRYI